MRKEEVREGGGEEGRTRMGRVDGLGNGGKRNIIMW